MKEKKRKGEKKKKSKGEGILGTPYDFTFLRQLQLCL